MSTESGRMVQRPVGPASRALLALVLIAGVLLLDACGGSSATGTGDEDAAGGGDGARRDDGAGDSGDAEPRADADDPEAVRPYVEDLLANYDEVVNQIIADPGVATDRDDLLVQQYLHLFEPDSQFAEDILANWEANAEAGVSMHPYDAEHPTNETRLHGEIAVESPDEVTAPVCIDQRYVVHENGRVTQGVPHKEQPGEVVAVRVDGEWLLRRRDVFANVTECDAMTDATTEGAEG